jgi:hypothetical protein
MTVAAIQLATLLCLAGDAGAPDAQGAGDATVVSAGGAAVDGAAVDGASTEASPSDAGAAAVAPKVHRLEGRVFARGGRRPVVGATIVVDVTSIADSDEKGRFAADVPCGKHHVAIQAPRFEVAFVERDACTDASPLVVRLTPRDGALAYETVVRAPTSQPQMRLEGAELLRTPGTMGDPFRALESLPGVAAVAWPAPIYAVRGANPGNTGFMLDDLRVPALFHLALGPSVIHPYFFDRLDFYPGGYPARYGRSVAGLVAAQTRAAPSDDLHASIDVRLLDAGGMVTAPLPGNGSIAIAGRYSYLGPIVGLLSSDVSLGYWDYQLRADRQVGAYKLTLLVFGSGDHFFQRNHDPAAAMQGGVILRFHRVKLRAERPLAGGRLVGSLGGGLDHTEAPLYDYVPLVIDSRSLMPRLAFLRPTTHADFEVGLDGELTRYEPFSQLARLGKLDLSKPRTARLLAAYASAAIRVGAPLIVTPELRLDTYAIAGAQKADLGPRLSARLAVGERTWLTATGGRYSQPPTFPLQIPGFENFGLALYGLQTSWQGSVGVGTTRFLGLETSVTGYVQRYVLTDVRDPTLDKTLDPLSDDFLTRRDALSYGAEVLVRRPATEKLHGWLSYTVSRNLRALGAGVIGPSDWDQRHIANLVLGYRLGRWTIGGRAHYNTGRPVLVTGNQGAAFERLPPFYQIDLRADRRFVFEKYTLEAYVELVNATLSRQTFDLTNPGPGSSTQANSFRIVLPSIGVHGEF